MIFLSNVLKRSSYQKRPPWDMILLVLSGKMVFFPRKHDNIFIGRKVRDVLSQEIHGNMVFSVYTCVTNVAQLPSVKKSRRWSYPAKVHLKVIDVLDWHSRKSSSNSLYFNGVLDRPFHVLLSSDKKQET